jgi:hypothetical protein
MNPDDIVAQAKAELDREDFLAAVAEAKTRILSRRAQPWWQRLIPFTIKIERRTDHV